MRKQTAWWLSLILIVPCTVLAQQSDKGASTASNTQATVSKEKTAAQQKTVAQPKAAEQPKRTDARTGKAMDHLELGTTDITGNRELPKVMYIVPWKRSGLGDLTGKPLDSLIDQTLQPVDRSVFRRENRYYRAVTGGAAQDGHPTTGGNAAPAARDER